MPPERNQSHPVTVVVPSFNRAATLERSLMSTLQQTRPPFEVIVVDDGSSDSTADVVEAIDDSRVRYIRHQCNRGAAAARNTGIAEARGQYIAFQDSDDVWAPTKLEHQMACFGHAPSEVGVVYSRWWRVFDGRRMLSPEVVGPPPTGRIHAALLRGNFITTPAAVVRRDCFDVVGPFDEALRRLQDWEMFLRIAERYEFRVVDQPLLTQYFTADSISAGKGTLIEATRFVMDKHRDWFDSEPGLRAHYEHMLGTWSCLDGRMRAGRKYLASAVRLDPLGVRHSFALLLSLFGAGAFGRAVRLRKRWADRGSEA